MQRSKFLCNFQHPSPCVGVVSNCWPIPLSIASLLGTDRQKRWQQQFETENKQGHATGGLLLQWKVSVRCHGISCSVPVNGLPDEVMSEIERQITSTTLHRWKHLTTACTPLKQTDKSASLQFHLHDLPISTAVRKPSATSKLRRISSLWADPVHSPHSSLYDTGRC